MNKSKALAALTASALAIPGIRPACAQTGTQLDYRYSAYREGDIAADKTSALDRERYQVDSHQFRAATVLGGNTDLAANIDVETMSGASPWFITPGADGRPVQVMSGASIHDFRQAIQLSAKRYRGELSATLLGGYSNERDYRSANGGLEASWSFDRRLNTLSGGASYTRNVLDPVEGRSTRFPDRIAHANNDQITGFLAYARVLGVDTQIQTSVSYSRLSGYLSDPYKLAYVAGNVIPDERPDGRRELVSLTRLRQYLKPLDAAVHLDYRYFWNDWKIRAHTVDFAWYQELPAKFQLVPGVRWYSQSQAYFYAPYYNVLRGDNFNSSDYRLSPYGALSYSVELNKALGAWKLRLRYENYRSGASYSTRHVDFENPGLVKFQVFSLGVSAGL